MANTLNKIEIVTDNKHLQIREVNEEGKYVRRVLTPDMDVSKEVAEIQEKAEAQWTNEVKDKWATIQAEEKAKINSEQ